MGALSGLISSAGDAFDKNITNDEERMLAQAELNKIKLEAARLFYEQQSKILQLQADVLKSEIVTGQWWQKLPRPLFAYLCIFIILNNYFIGPAVQTYFHVVYPHVVLPTELWNLMTVAIGSYFITRGAAKMQAAKGVNK